jgi:hypothetical protein
MLHRHHADGSLRAINFIEDPEWRTRHSPKEPLLGFHFCVSSRESFQRVDLRQQVSITLTAFAGESCAMYSKMRPSCASAAGEMITR